ncbi:M23 family metallopeptidase [Paenibacillus amylolyticus]|nr:M23 family metallopeptidase [Paenibacillus amylolyticus]
MEMVNTASQDTSRKAVFRSKGDKLKQGDPIGELGNSGNSSEAHLHFQVSDGPDLFTSRSINIRWADQSQQFTRGNTIQGLPE